MSGVITKVTKFVTPDGKEHPTERDADYHMKRAYLFHHLIAHPEIPADVAEYALNILQSSGSTRNHVRQWLDSVDALELGPR